MVGLTSYWMMICSGLRNLVGKIEKEQRLAEMQALRNHSRLKLLVSESDFERQVNVGEHGQNTSETEILQKWEAYQSAWSEFVRKYGKKESGISSSVGDDGKQEINFQDVPWPLMSRKGSEGTVCCLTKPALVFRCVLFYIWTSFLHSWVLFNSN